MRRFLVVGCGGSGGAALAYLMDQLRSDLARHGVDRLPRGWQFVHIDVPTTSDPGPDGLASVQQQGGTYVGCGPADGTYRTLDGAVSKRFTRQAGVDLGAVATWAPRRPDLVSKPVSVGAGQARAIGRMITLSHVDEIGRVIERALTDLGRNEARGDMLDLRARVPGTGDYDHNDRLVVLVVSSMAGGAGASMALDVCRLLTLSGSVDPNLMGVFMVAPNIFDSFPEPARAGVRPNALAMLGEIVASQTGAARRHDVAVLSALGHRRGEGERVPFARVFPVGRYAGVDRMQFGDGSPNAVYRGLGRGLAGLMLSGSATDQFVSFDLGNNLSPDGDRSLLGWGAEWAALPWGSYGFASLSMGRDRYAEYAAQRLSRSCVERLLRGHLQRGSTASSVEQVQALLDSQWATTCDRGLLLPDLRVPAAHVDAAMGAWLSQAALPWAEADGLALDVCRQHVEPYVPHPGGIPAAQWSASLNQVAARRTTVSTEADRAAAQWAFRWHTGLQARIESTVTDCVARLGLPYAVALVERLVQHCRDVLAPAARRLTVHAPPDLVGVPPQVQSYLAGTTGVIGNGRELLDHLLQGYREQVRTHLYAHSAGLVEQLLLALTTDVLQPLLVALGEAQRDLEVAEAAPPSDVGLARLATDQCAAWPSDADASVQSRFTEADNEVLLTSSADYQREYVGHVRRALGHQQVGDFEATRDRIVTQVVAGVWSTTDGVRPPGSPLRRGAEWRTMVFPLDPVSDEPRTPSQARYDLHLRPRDVLQRARGFIARGGESFAQFCSLSIRDFVEARGEGETERRARTDLVVAKFADALTLARPLVSVHSAALQRVHGTAIEYRYKFSEVPLAGLAVQERFERVVIDNAMIDQASLDNLRAALAEGRRTTRVDVFGSYPNYSPLVFDAVLAPAAEQWSRPGGHQQFWEWRRSRPLDAALPMGDAERAAMVAGWFVGQIIGAVRIPPPPHDEPVRIWDEDEGRWLDFPHPMLTPPRAFLAEYDWLPAVLESVLLAVARCQESPVMASLRPYQVLRGLYDDADQEQQGGLLVLAGRRLLTGWLRGDPAPGGGASRVPGIGSAGTADERADAAVDWLDRIAGLAGTHFMPPGDGAPGGGTFSVITKREQASATPLFRDVAPDVHRAARTLVRLIDQARRDLAQPVETHVGVQPGPVPTTRFDVPAGGTF